MKKNSEKKYVLELTRDEIYNLHEATSALSAMDRQSVQLAKRGGQDKKNHGRFAKRCALSEHVYDIVNHKLAEIDAPKPKKVKPKDHTKKTKKSKYYVELWEYERGWGSNCFMTKYFETEDEAKESAKEVNDENTETTVPDYYIIAKGPFKL